MKKWLIIAALLIVVGCVAFVVTMAALDWDFTRLSTTQYDTNTYTASEDFSKIHIFTEEADVLFALSDDNTCKVLCQEEANARHAVDVQNDSLYIRVQNEKKWYEYIGIHFGSPKITVYLPQSQYDALFIQSDTGDVTVPEEFQFNIMDISVSTGDVKSYAAAVDTMKIETSTGDIRLENVTTKMLQLNVSTGDVYLSNVRCQSLNTKGSTGDIQLKNVVAEGRFAIERSTGNVKFEHCDATEIYVQTDTGDVTGSLLSDKVFLTKTSTGTIRVPKTTTGGTCSITTSTGNIKLEIQ